MPIYFIIFGLIFRQEKCERGSRSLSLHAQQGGSLVFRNSPFNSSSSPCHVYLEKFSTLTIHWHQSDNAIPV